MLPSWIMHVNVQKSQKYIFLWVMINCSKFVLIHTAVGFLGMGWKQKIDNKKIKLLFTGGGLFGLMMVLILEPFFFEFSGIEIEMVSGSISLGYLVLNQLLTIFFYPKVIKFLYLTLCLTVLLSWEYLLPKFDCLGQGERSLLVNKQKQRKAMIRIKPAMMPMAMYKAFRSVFSAFDFTLLSSTSLKSPLPWSLLISCFFVTRHCLSSSCEEVIIKKSFVQI